MAGKKEIKGVPDESKMIRGVPPTDVRKVNGSQGGNQTAENARRALEIANKLDGGKKP